MPKEEWGKKRVCPTTGRRFYDLNKSPIVSPYTGDVVSLDTGKSNRMMVADKPDKDARQEDVAEDEEVVLDEEEESTDVDLGDDVLEDDDDDSVSLDDIADVSSDDDD